MEEGKYEIKIIIKQTNAYGRKSSEIANIDNSDYFKRWDSECSVLLHRFCKMPFDILEWVQSSLQT